MTYPFFSDFIAGLPQAKQNDNYDYQDEDYNYDDDEVHPNHEEEDEKEFTIYKDITFLTSKIQQTHMVDKGTTIKLSCIVDKYPGM